MLNAESGTYELSPFLAKNMHHASQFPVPSTGKQYMSSCMYFCWTSEKNSFWNGLCIIPVYTGYYNDYIVIRVPIPL